METNGIEVTSVRTGPTLSNDAPAYHRRDGGAHWTFRTPAGVEASALRGDKDMSWTFFDPYGNQTQENHVWTNDDAIQHIKSMVRTALIQDLKDVG